MKLISTVLFILFSLYYSLTARAATVSTSKPAKSPAASTRLKQQQVSKSLYAKLKAQALNEARAELAREQEQRERAKLEALEELNAGAGDASTTDSPSPDAE